MDIIPELVTEIWRSLSLGPLEKSLLKALLLALCIHVVVYAIERLSQARTNHYRSRSFLHDLAYWVYYRAGLHDLLFTAALIAALERPLSFASAGLLTPLPFFLQAALYLVVGDFVAYWIHRAEHRFRWMWAFHTTHHSQRQLTFATTARFHPVEMIYHNLLAYIPMRMLGADPMSWFPMYLAVQLYASVQHTQIPWKLGPLYKVLATPSFHAYHHSMEPAHHDRNFANLFSAWDYLFATAVRDREPTPTSFGLAGVADTSLLQSLAMPFRLLLQWYRPSPPEAKRHARN